MTGKFNPSSTMFSWWSQPGFHGVRFNVLWFSADFWIHGIIPGAWFGFRRFPVKEVSQ